VKLVRPIIIIPVRNHKYNVRVDIRLLDLYRDIHVHMKHIHMHEYVQLMSTNHFASHIRERHFDYLVPGTSTYQHDEMTTVILEFTMDLPVLHSGISLIPETTGTWYLVVFSSFLLVWWYLVDTVT